MNYLAVGSLPHQARGRQPGSGSLAGTPGGGAGWASFGAVLASTGDGDVGIEKPMAGWHILSTQTGTAWLRVGKAPLPPLHCLLSVHESLR